MRGVALRRLTMVSVVAVGVVAMIMMFGKLASADTHGTASLTIKVEAPENPPHGFAFSGGYNTPAGPTSFSASLSGGDEYLLSDIVTTGGSTVSIHQVVENEPLLWRLSEISCVEDWFLFTTEVDFVGDVDSGELAVYPESGQDIFCTFTNDFVAASFSFGPEVASGDSTQPFEYQARLSNQFDVTLTDGVRHSQASLPVPYQYAVSQTAVPGWDTSVSCTGGSIAGSGEDPSGNTYVHVNVEDNDDVRCIFRNTFVGSSLTIDVNAPDDHGKVFSFFGSYTAPTGDTTGPGGEFRPDLRHGQSYTEAFIVGQGILLAVSEEIPDGWRVIAIDCFEIVDSPVGEVSIPYNPSYFDLETGYVQLDPAAGAHYRCTFENDYIAGRLSFGPEVVSGDTGQNFRYRARLDDDVSVSLAEGAFYGDDLLTVPGQYAVVQEAQPGWETTVRCNGGDIAGEGTEPDGDTYVHIEIAEEETVRCTFYNTYVNEPPVADAGGPYELNEGSSLIFDGSASSDPDGDSLTYEWDLDNDGAYDDATGPAPELLYPDGPAAYTVGLKVTDPLGETDTDTTSVTVNNVAPQVGAPLVDPAPSDEGAVVTASATFTDPAGAYDTYTCTVDYGDGPMAGTVEGYKCSGPSYVYADNGSFPITVTVSDDDGGIGSASAPHMVLNVPPTVSVSSDAQTLQYSDLIDEIAITVTDVAADDLEATVTALPGLSLDPTSCSVESGVKTCEWTLSGPVRVPAGSHSLSVTVQDDDGGTTTTEIAITVLHEDGVVVFGSDNPIVVPVTDPGSDKSESFSLFAYVREALETGDSAAPGDIGLADVSLTLEPVGPGSPVTVACSSTAPVVPYDYSAVLEVRCGVAEIPVNAYVATVFIAGDYYRGEADEDVVVVFDPSLGFTTGGGWFAWPGTGERTTFGYTMKYNKKATNAQGSMVVIRRTADGERYRLKSNAIFGLALGDDGDIGWASFLGKATYLEPGMAEAEGNHTFMVYVEDRGEPGAGADRFWLEVMDKDGSPVALSFSRPAGTNAAELGGGNIVVPHKPRKGAR